MPVATTYPGVYVQEVPSAVRTITGVATSVTAFVGRASRGPTDRVVAVNNFGEYEATFGALSIDGALGFAVRDFFLNGGSKALVVRLYHAATGKGSTATLKVGELPFVAASPGKWGVGLRVVVDRKNTTQEVADSLGVQTDELFNLTVTDTFTRRSEKYLNLTLKDSARRVDKVLWSQSDLVRYALGPKETAPDPKLKLPDADKVAQDELSGLEDALDDAKQKLADAQNKGEGIEDAKKAKGTAEKALQDAVDKANAGVSDGDALTVLDFLPTDARKEKIGLFLLENADIFNILCIPPYRAATDTTDVDPNLVAAAAAYCEERRAMLLLDAPKNWDRLSTALGEFNGADEKIGTRSANAALYFPRLRYPNPLADSRVDTFSAIGAIAGIYARTDTQRGVWKAPAGLDATVNGATQLSVPLTDAENGDLNPLGINCLRAFPVGGRVIWGARTLRGADQLADQYKYVPVRRTALYIEESLFRGLKWVVFEPNSEPLWAQIRLNVGAFMHDLFRQGAFQGASPREAYFVKCDSETTTQTDINLGIVNVVVGFAPLKPAEFVILKLQQITGQIEV